MDVKLAKGDQWNVPKYFWLKHLFTRVAKIDKKKKILSHYTVKFTKLTNFNIKTIKKQNKTKKTTKKQRKKINSQ